MRSSYKSLILSALLPLVACGEDNAVNGQPRTELSDIAFVPTGFGKVQTASGASARYVVTWRSREGRACGIARLGNGVEMNDLLALREAEFSEAIKNGVQVKAKYIAVRRDDRKTETPPKTIDGCIFLQKVEFQWPNEYGALPETDAVPQSPTR